MFVTVYKSTLNLALNNTCLLNEFYLVKQNQGIHLLFLAVVVEKFYFWYFTSQGNHIIENTTSYSCTP